MKTMCCFSSKVICDKGNNFGDIMIMALRYTMGRSTYVTGEVSDFIKENKAHINSRIRDVMINDINKHLNDIRENLIKSDECDINSFVSLLAFLKEIGDNIDRTKIKVGNN